jgi:hypothetical protein
MSSWSQIKQSVIDRFYDRAHLAPGMDVTLLDNPTEELVHDVTHGRAPKLFAKGNGKRPPSRLEENYLYHSRRFPVAVDNVIGAGAVAAAQYRFFQSAMGNQGAGDGFPTGFQLSSLETNMDTPGQIAQGKNFALRSVGVSFNASAAGADIEQLVDAAALIFTKQGDQYSLRHGPVRLWPGGSGVSGHAATTVAATTISSANNGIADPRAVRTLRVPRMIRQKDSFAYIFDVPRATRANNGVAIALSDFVVATVFLWGGQLDRIPD